MCPQSYVRPPEFAVIMKENLPITYATGVFGGLAPNDARMMFYADRIELEPGEVPGTQKVKKINQEIQVDIHLSPATFKSIVQWMTQQLERYEKVFGEIKFEPIKENSPTKDSYVK
jgi:hypothetical protein